MKKLSKTNENLHEIVVFSKNIDLVQVFIGFWYIFHWKSMPLSSEINVFAESLDFLFFCLGIFPLWILGLTGQMYYVVHPHGWARSTLTGSILKWTMDTTMQSTNLEQVYQWWIGQNRSVFFWKSRHMVRSEQKLMNIIKSLLHVLYFK